MTAKDYPITEGYGKDPTYPLNTGYHRGIDYGCPMGTPVVVNGVQIGLSGNTGYVTGPHLHVGRFVNNEDTDPTVGGGFDLKTPVTVTTVGSDSTNGSYIRLTDGYGVEWVYLHLSRQDVKQGETLRGGDELSASEREILQSAINAARSDLAAEKQKSLIFESAMNAARQQLAALEAKGNDAEKVNSLITDIDNTLAKYKEQ